MKFWGKVLILPVLSLTNLFTHVNSAYALKRQDSQEIQGELTQWLRENDKSSKLSTEEKDQRREFIFKVRLKTLNKDSFTSRKQLAQDFKKSTNPWENTLGELLDTELERGETLISFLKDYVTAVPQIEDFSEELQSFKSSRLYFDGQKMQEANPQDFEEAGQSAEHFLKQKENFSLPGWYRLDLSAPLKPLETIPEASKTP